MSWSRVVTLGALVCRWCPTSADIAAILPENNVNGIFIDALHGFVDVSTDLQICATKVRPGGLIAAHDFESNLFDVQVAVYLLARSLGVNALHIGWDSVFWMVKP